MPNHSADDRSRDVLDPELCHCGEPGRSGLKRVRSFFRFLYWHQLLFRGNQRYGRRPCGASATDNTLPWTLRIFSPVDTCLRAEVISQTRDLEIVLVQPDGTVFRDDDGGLGLQPLVKVDGTSDRGWNTLQVSRFNGDALGANFTMLYGVYPAWQSQLRVADHTAFGGGPEQQVGGVRSLRDR